jgi:hypothetical protein
MSGLDSFIIEDKVMVLGDSLRCEQERQNLNFTQ